MVGAAVEVCRKLSIDGSKDLVMRILDDSKARQAAAQGPGAHRGKTRVLWMDGAPCVAVR